MKRICFFMLLLWSVHSFAQPQFVREDSVHVPYEQMVDSIFQPLDLTEVTTDLLLDRGFGFLPIENHDGIPDTENLIPAFEIWEAVYATLYTSSHPLGSVLNTPEEAYRDETSNLSPTDPVPIPILYFIYHQLKPTAVDDDLLYWENSQLHDVVGRTESPYELKVLTN